MSVSPVAGRPTNCHKYQKKLSLRYLASMVWTTIVTTAMTMEATADTIAHGTRRRLDGSSGVGQSRARVSSG